MAITNNTVLMLGDSGEEVLNLQQALIENNFYPDINAQDNGVDGIFGPNTENAVVRFQVMNGLTVDGIAGPSTLSSLGLIDGSSGEVSGTTILRPGHSSDAVKELQQALVDSNFYPDINADNNGVDGIYGPNTEDAVRRYQIMYGLSVDGIAGQETLSSLGISEGDYSGGETEYTGTLRNGDFGEAVRMLQQSLIDNNFYPDINSPDYGVDGIYGPNTEDAVRRYQTMNGLTVDGIAEPETLSSLGIAGAGSGSERGPGQYGDTLRPGDRGDAVRALQEALVDNNFYPDFNAEDNGVDGIYGPNTKDAVRRYQIIHGLTIDGIAGPETLSTLGLKHNDTDENNDETPDFDGELKNLTVSQLFISPDNYNRPGYAMSPNYITIHETANTAPGATAFMHANYVRNSTTQTSWHFTVDDSPMVYQHLPINETGFHAGDGDGEGNRNSIGIELCVNDGGDFSQTVRNATVLVRKLMGDYNISIENVVTHNHWSGKLCPANLLDNFEVFREQVMSLPTLDPLVDYEFISSPFTDIVERYPVNASNGSISYSTSYDVNLGPLQGSLTGSIIIGDPSNTIWDLSADSIINGDLIDNKIDELLNIMAQESLLPGISDVAEAKAEIEGIIGEDTTNIVEVKLSTFDINVSQSYPWIDMD